MKDSRLSGFYRLSVADRINQLESRGWISPENASSLRSGRATMSSAAADKIVENVVGTFALPLSIAPNFVVNGRECIVPLVVEEPSIVAALSNAAAMARSSGGFTAVLDESLLAGQIHIVGLSDIEASRQILQSSTNELLTLANAVHPRLVTRGGGVRDIEYRALQLPGGESLLVLHLLVDTADAMGANLVNSICESIAPKVSALCGGEIALRILSNLADRSVVTARVSYSVDVLQSREMPGNEVRDRIVLASDIASVDPHRAATHNKGVMNGIDALAIATGNDWRAIEAGAHAYVARDGHYGALTRWSVGPNGDLLGEIQIPLKTGIVGGTLSSNPAAKLGLEIAAVESSTQLAELMAAVGLAQNFAALRALATSGIQQGHMRLHARSVATAAGAPEALLEAVVDKLVASGEVKDWKAAEIVAELSSPATTSPAFTSNAAGKIILFGEHAVVYGRHALAVPVPDAVRAVATEHDRETTLRIREWGLNCVVSRGDDAGVDGMVNLICSKLGVGEANFNIEASSALPPGMGLGSSAAVAVAITRAIAACSEIELNDTVVNEIAFDCEKLAHGTPSGIDNTIACFARAMLYRRKGEMTIRNLQLAEIPPLLIGFSHAPGSTLEQVAGVRSRRERNSHQYDRLFDQIDEITTEAVGLLEQQRYEELGPLMNICQGLLNALQVSTPDLEAMIAIARSHGAIGAKITGAGGGGSMVALCPGTEDAVSDSLQQAGYRCLRLRDFTGGVS